MLAGFGLGQLTRFTMLHGGSRFGLGIYDAGRFVARETSPSNVQLSYDLARYLDMSSGSNRVAILVNRSHPN